MAKRHMLRIKKDYFDLMNEKVKTLDVRVGYPEILKIEEGDMVSFQNYGENCFDVVRVTVYNEFAEMLDNENSQLIIPGITKYEVLKILQEVYPEEKERLGVYVIEYEKHKYLKDNYKIIQVSSIAHKNRITFGSIINKAYAVTDSICKMYPKHFSWYWNKVVPGVLIGTHEIFICMVDKNISGIIIVKKEHKKGEICVFKIVDEYWESEILMNLVQQAFNFLKTNKPHIIMPDNKLHVFEDIIEKYDWKKTQEFLAGYYSDSSKALVFN